MDTAIGTPREGLSDFAPRIFIMKIKPEKIRDVIGPGGKVIKQITADSGPCRFDDTENSIRSYGCIYCITPFFKNIDSCLCSKRLACGCHTVYSYNF